MTDPQSPDAPTPPPAYGSPPPENPPPAAAQPAYPAAPPASSGAPANPAIPGRTMGIVAFILSFFIQLVGLILGIVALVQSRKAGHKNGWALAAIIISSVLIVVGIIVGIAVIGTAIAGAGEYARLCAEYGSGVHQINGVEVTLTCPS